MISQCSGSCIDILKRERGQRKIQRGKKTRFRERTHPPHSRLTSHSMSTSEEERLCRLSLCFLVRDCIGNTWRASQTHHPQESKLTQLPPSVRSRAKLGCELHHPSQKRENMSASSSYTTTFFPKAQTHHANKQSSPSTPRR